MDLLPFQKRFLRAVRSHPCAILSVPRGNGKSSFAASLLQACLTPGSSWHQPGRESFLIASSVAQARRTTWGILRAAIEDDPAYRVLDTAQNCTAKHKASGARVSIVASIGKRAYGIVNAPLIIGDEPAGWENGEELWEALWTSLGKPQEVPTRLLLVGTLAPAQPDAWWPALVAAGTTPRRHVTCLRGRDDRWDQTSEIRKVNPLMWRFTASRRTLLAERDDARQNPAAEDSFKRQRINIPGVNADESLLTQADLAGILPRPVPPRHGRPVVGIDLGDSPSWSAAVAIWPNGRTEAVGLTAGIPDLDKQEKRDQARRGSYARMVANGTLLVADGLHQQPPGLLIDRVLAWDPVIIMGDTFRKRALLDAIRGRCRLNVRRVLWKESTEDIGALRKAARDAALAFHEPARSILAYGLSRAEVRQDEQGNKRLVKKGGKQSLRRRDDIAQALLLAAGAHDRRPADFPTSSFIG